MCILRLCTAVPCVVGIYHYCFEKRVTFTYFWLFYTPATYTNQYMGTPLSVESKSMYRSVFNGSSSSLECDNHTRHEFPYAPASYGSVYI